MYFKFRCLDKNSISSLANDSIWFSNVSLFNDPFETLPISRMKNKKDEKYELQNLVLDEFNNIDPIKQKYLSDLARSLGRGSEKTIGSGQQFRDSINYIIDTVENEKYSVLSLSSDKRSQHRYIATSKLMWSHYANGLRGFCIGFGANELNKNGFYRINSLGERKICTLSVDVKYLNSYGNQSPINSIKDYLVGDSEFDLSKLFSIKSNDWSYEDEIRYISPFSGLHKYEHSSVEALIIGEKMSMEDRLLLIKLANAALPCAEIYIAKLSSKCFDIELELIYKGDSFID